MIYRKKAKIALIALTILILCTFCLSACGSKKTADNDSEQDEITPTATATPVDVPQNSDSGDNIINPDKEISGYFSNIESYVGDYEFEDGTTAPILYIAPLCYVIYDNNHAEVTYTMFTDDTLSEYTILSSIPFNGESYPVTVIEDCAFSGFSELEKITIPDSVTTIGANAFSDCQKLASIDLPNSVIEIGEYAFSDCLSLASLIVPDSVTKLGAGCFSDCPELISAKLSDSMTIVPDSLFTNCEKLTNVTLPAAVTTVSSEAFWSCESLDKLILPETVTTIGNRVFYNCMSLSSITLPDSITYIGEDIFDYCDALSEIIVSEARYDYFYEQLSGYLIDIIAK